MASITRQECYKQITPCLLVINKLAAHPPQGPDEPRELIKATLDLFNSLSEHLRKEPNLLDESLTNHVFIPLSKILKNIEHYPDRLFELAIKCLTILVVHGWGPKISAAHVHQLFIFLTLVLQKRESHEESTLEVFRALTALITAAGSSLEGASELTALGSLPTLGVGIKLILDGITDGANPDIQVEASRTLQALFGAIKDHQALASFLPGVVSALTAALSSPAGRKQRALVAMIGSLEFVLVQVLDDLRTRSIAARKEEPKSEGGKAKSLTASWLNETSSQVKVALSHVLKLRNNESEALRQAIEKLCLTLLNQCHDSLANCTDILVESALLLSPERPEETLAPTSLNYTAILYPELGDMIKVTVYNWIASMPRLMQASDEQAKQQAIRSIQKGMAAVASLQIDSSTLDDSLSSALRDGISTLLDASKNGKVLNESDLTMTLWNVKAGTSYRAEMPKYSPVLMGHESQLVTRAEILNLISNMGSQSQLTKYAADVLDYVRASSGTSQVSAYWLSFELVKARLAHTADIDDLLDLSTTAVGADDVEQVLHDLYDFSATILDSHSELADVDWRMEALALEVTAYAAARSGTEFRPELIDVLYPIATFLGSQDARLRSHAIVTLNNMALSCGYDSVSELIIDNVDYMVNSISLRLNTMDISPASTKVLTMMVRLAGPRLIPFLDDVIASIFAALENYHGYPIFVESLFAVLKEVVEQGVKSDKLLLEGPKSSTVDHRKRRAKEMTVDDIVATLDKVAQRRAKMAQQGDSEGEEEAVTGHPSEPWGPDKPKGADETQLTEQERKGLEDDAKAKTPTYALLEKVAALTQHYLTSPSPALRRSLLDLLATVSPALAADEDAYLPLVNAVWPVAAARLYDPEPFVAVAACDALAALCAAAGDFLASRVRAAWRERLGRWCRDARRAAELARGVPERRRLAGPAGGAGADIVVPVRSGAGELEARKPAELAGGGLGRFAQAVLVWEAVVRLLTAVVSFVRVEDRIFDEVLDLLEEVAARDARVREALEVVNADAVWLAMYKRGRVERLEPPVVAGAVFPPMERFRPG